MDGDIGIEQIRNFRIEKSIIVPILHYLSKSLSSSAFAGGRSPFLPPPPPSISGHAEGGHVYKDHSSET
jgi:hypothetical protein